MGKTSQNAATNMGGDAMQNWLEMVNEGVQFVVTRVQQDLEFQQSLLSCRNLEDLQRVQGDFYRKAMEHYSTESSRIMDRLSNSKSGPAAMGATKRRFDDVPI